MALILPRIRKEVLVIEPAKDMDVHNFRYLFMAIEAGDHKRIRQVCETPGFNINFKIYSPMMADVTCSRKKEKLFNYFGSNRVKIGPLDVAIIFNDIVAVKILMEHNPDLALKINRRVSSATSILVEVDEEVCSAIHLVTILHHNEILKELIHGCDELSKAVLSSVLSSEDHQCRSPLDLAFLFDNLEAVQLLSQAGATFAKVTNGASGKVTSRMNLCSFMDKYCNKQKPEVILRMMELGYDHGPEIVASFIRNMDLEETSVLDCFSQLVQSEEVAFDVNQRFGLARDSYLHLAAHQHCLWLVQYFLKLGLDPNGFNLLNENALHSVALACHFGSDGPAVVQSLLDVGTDSLAVDVKGRTPIHTAVQLSNHSVILTLLQGYIPVDSDSQGFNLLHHYCNEGNINLNVLRRLMNIFDVDETTKTGWTPLMLLVNRIEDDDQQIQWVLELLSETKNYGAKNPLGDTFLTIALIRGLNQLVFEMKRFFPDHQTGDGNKFVNQDWTLLVNTPDRDGISPIMFSVLNPLLKSHIFHFLLASGADISLTDTSGRNILYMFLIKNEPGSTIVTPEVGRSFTFWTHQLEKRILNSSKIQQPCDTSKLYDIQKYLTSNPALDVNYDCNGKYPSPLTIAIQIPGYQSVVEELIANFADVSKVTIDDATEITPTLLNNCLQLQKVGFNKFDRLFARMDHLLETRRTLALAQRGVYMTQKLLQKNRKTVQPLSRLAANIARMVNTRSKLEETCFKLKPDCIKLLFTDFQGSLNPRENRCTTPPFVLNSL